VYVASSHSLFRKEGKVSKRYGRIMKSECTTLNGMMTAHFDDCVAWIKDATGLESEGEAMEDVESIVEVKLGVTGEDVVM